MTLLHEDVRNEVAVKALELLTTGLVINTSGNVSRKVDDHVIITPSGCDYRDLDAGDICVVDLTGQVVSGKRLPSSETPLHLAVYQAQPDVRAIVHTHSVYATAVSTLVDVLPAIHYQIVDLGGPVPVAPYRLFGTVELATVVTETLQGRNAALMKNHGSLTTGDTLAQALARSVTLEWLSRVYLLSVQAGSPTLLDEAQLASVESQFAKFAELRRQGSCCDD